MFKPWEIFLSLKYFNSKNFKDNLCQPGEKFYLDYFSYLTDHKNLLEKCSEFSALPGLTNLN